MRKGFTLIELGVCIAVITVLLSITTMNLTSLQNRSYLNNTLETLMSDIKHQQLKSMSGSTDGESSHEVYGIYFESDRYTLFRGPAYDINDPLNFPIVLNESLEFTNILFPSSYLIFTKGNGEVVGFTPTSNAITIHNMNTEETKTIQLNKYGAITSIN